MAQTYNKHTNNFQALVEGGEVANKEGPFETKGP
jgi:hypothetical protein